MFESAALISPSAILDFHSQHSVHSAPGSRMVGMVFYPFRNRIENAHILHSGHSRILDKKRALRVRSIDHIPEKKYELFLLKITPKRIMMLLEYRKELQHR